MRGGEGCTAGPQVVHLDQPEVGVEIGAEALDLHPDQRLHGVTPIGRGFLVQHGDVAVGRRHDRFPVPCDAPRLTKAVPS